MTGELFNLNIICFSYLNAGRIQENCWIMLLLFKVLKIKLDMAGCFKVKLCSGALNGKKCNKILYTGMNILFLSSLI